MRGIFLLFLSVLPIIIIAIYMYNKDKNKEPIRVLINIFLGGIISAVVVIIVNTFIYAIFPGLTLEEIVKANIIMKLIKIFIGVAIIEEGGKWLLTYLGAYNSRHFDEYYDIILFSALTALGFAFLENVIYVFKHGVATGFIRLFTAVPAHCFFGSIMGKYLGHAKIEELNGNRNSKNKYIVLSILLPAVLHSIYDYFAFMGGIYSMIFFVATVIFGYMISFDIIKNASNFSIITYRQNYCTNCGARVEGNFCSFCGKRN